MNLSHNEKNEHLANMPDARLQNKGNHHATFRTRSSKPVRLPLKSQRSPCGDFAMDSFRASGNSGNPLQPEPPNKTAARTAAMEQGVRGKRHFAFPPAALRARVDDPSTRESGSMLQLRPSLNKPHISQTNKSKYIIFIAAAQENASPTRLAFPLFT